MSRSWAPRAGCDHYLVCVRQQISEYELALTSAQELDVDIEVRRAGARMVDSFAHRSPQEWSVYNMMASALRIRGRNEEAAQMCVMAGCRVSVCARDCVV